MEELSSQLNKFAFNLYKILKNQNEDNIIISPLSIATALCMTLGGAKENTAQEMKSTLHVGKIEDSQIHKSFSSILKVLNKSEDVTLYVANKAVVEKQFKVVTEFVDHLVKSYNTSIVRADFQGNLLNEVDAINKWVEEVTKSKIKDLLSPNVVSPATRLVLINAIYFKGLWKYPFRPEITQKGQFQTGKNQVKEVDMMYLEKKFRFYSCEPLKCEILEIPYKDENYNMLIFLPNEQDGLKFVECNITAEILTSAIEGLADIGDVELTLPKFKLETSAALKELLVELGMKDSFTEKADFSGISGGKDLCIDNVIHKAVIEVNEEGTEAAAATAVVMKLMCMRYNKIFRVDHPFLYALVSKKFNSILFMGRLLEP